MIINKICILVCSLLLIVSCFNGKQKLQKSEDIEDNMLIDEGEEPARIDNSSDKINEVIQNQPDSEIFEIKDTEVNLESVITPQTVATSAIEQNVITETPAIETTPSEDIPEVITEDFDLDGVTVEEGDCNDFNATIYPNADELCDGLDNDCDDNYEIDENPGTNGILFNEDYDGDGFGNSQVIMYSCSPVVVGWVTNYTDCNDDNISINPNMTELADGIDNNCNGAVDDGLVGQVFYIDEDSDGDGNPLKSTIAVVLPSGYSLYGNDCDDSSALMGSTIETEVCDNIDNDCDGKIDEDVTTTYYVDNDGDGFGTHDGKIVQCSEIPAPTGSYASQAGDCNDSDSNNFPTIFVSNIMSGAFATIQEAINYAYTNDCIAVYEGVYTESLTITDKKLTLISLFGAENTSISGGTSGRVFDINLENESYNLSLAGIIGFDIQYGFSNFGSGIFGLNLNNFVIKHNIIDNNIAFSESYTTGQEFIYGGGIYLLNSNNVDIEGNIIRYNSVLSTSKVTAGGGIVFLNVDNSSITNNVITNNSTISSAELGNTYEYRWSKGGGIYSSNSLVSIENNNILNNYSHYGGGIDISGYENIIISNNTIDGNQSKVSGGGLSSDIYYGTATATLTNNIFSDNLSRVQAGAISYNHFNILHEFRNNVFIRNNAGYGSAIVFSYTRSLSLTNNIFIANGLDSSLDLVNRKLIGLNSTDDAVGPFNITNNLFMFNYSGAVESQGYGLIFKNRYSFPQTVNIENNIFMENLSCILNIRAGNENYPASQWISPFYASSNADTFNFNYNITYNNSQDFCLENSSLSYTPLSDNIIENDPMLIVESNSLYNNVNSLGVPEIFYQDYFIDHSYYILYSSSPASPASPAIGTGNADINRDGARDDYVTNTTDLSTDMGPHGYIWGSAW